MRTLFSTYNKIHSFVPDKAGVTLAQVALYGRNYSLNYIGFNNMIASTGTGNDLPV
jgi:hypothetical protein